MHVGVVDNVVWYGMVNVFNQIQYNIDIEKG